MEASIQALVKNTDSIRTGMEDLTSRIVQLEAKSKSGALPSVPEKTTGHQLTTFPQVPRGLGVGGLTIPPPPGRSQDIGPGVVGGEVAVDDVVNLDDGDSLDGDESASQLQKLVMETNKAVRLLVKTQYSQQNDPIALLSGSSSSSSSLLSGARGAAAREAERRALLHRPQVFHLRTRSAMALAMGGDPSLPQDGVMFLKQSSAFNQNRDAAMVAWMFAHISSSCGVP